MKTTMNKLKAAIIKSDAEIKDCLTDIRETNNQHREELGD
jgi:hypothetical protein